MEATRQQTDMSSEQPLSPEPPVRVLVQTLTHLVPGNDYFERLDFILDCMCQHHWNCNFSVPKFRWAAYNTQFALPNKRCFFLVDYGQSQNDDEVPALPYEWTGEALKPQPQLTKDPEILSKLKEDFPFTYKPRPSNREPRPIRKIIKSELYSDGNIMLSELNYMREHPEDLEWLKRHVRPRFWQKFVAMMNERKPPGDPDIQE